MPRIPAAMLAAGLAALALAAPGCASSKTPEDAPDWFVQSLNDKNSDYPSLRSVPTANIANNDAAHWARVADELRAAAEAMRANARNQPAPGDDPATFADEARRDIEATRDTH